jgi:hypothetical protein
MGGWHGQGIAAPNIGGAGRGRGAGSAGVGRGASAGRSTINANLHNLHEATSTSLGSTNHPYGMQSIYSNHSRADYNYGPRDPPGVMTRTSGGYHSRSGQRSYDSHIMVGSGRTKTATQFMSEGLRQQLQLNSYLVQAQV